MKIFNRRLSEVAEPTAGDEINFKAKHIIQKIDYPVDVENQFTYKKPKAPKRRADYDKGEDKAVYENSFDVPKAEGGDYDEEESHRKYKSSNKSKKIYHKNLNKKEKLEEISSDTLNRYIKKAAYDIISRTMSASRSHQTPETKKHASKLGMRIKGISMASDNLTKKASVHEDLNDTYKRLKDKYLNKAFDDSSNNFNLYRQSNVASKTKKFDSKETTNDINDYLNKSFDDNSDGFNLYKQDNIVSNKTKKSNIKETTKKSKDNCDVKEEFSQKIKDFPYSGFGGSSILDLWRNGKYSTESANDSKEQPDMSTLKNIHKEFQFYKNVPAYKILELHKNICNIRGKYTAQDVGGKIRMIHDILCHTYGDKNVSYYFNLPKTEVNKLNEEAQLNEASNNKMSDKIFKDNLNVTFKPGLIKLNDGSSIILKDQDAKLLNQFFNDLNVSNRKKMMKVAMTDKVGFKEILGFAREAL